MKADQSEISSVGMLEMTKVDKRVVETGDPLVDSKVGSLVAMMVGSMGIQMAGQKAVQKA